MPRGSDMDPRQAVLGWAPGGVGVGQYARIAESHTLNEQTQPFITLNV
jgi:hypothetical protein